MSQKPVILPEGSMAQGKLSVCRLWSQKDSDLKVEFSHLVITDASDLTMGPGFNTSNKHTVIQ